MTEHERMREILGFGLLEGDRYDLAEQKSTVTTRREWEKLLENVVLCMPESCPPNSND